MLLNNLQDIGWLPRKKYMAPMTKVPSLRNHSTVIKSSPAQTLRPWDGPVMLWKPVMGLRASLRLGVLRKALGGRGGSGRPAAGTGECSG